MIGMENHKKESICGNNADVDRLAEVYANDSYEIENVYSENLMKMAGQTTQTHQ